MLRRVLVIDDEQNILATIKGSLEDEGYVVDTAANAKAGIERFKKFAPDVVLLDVWLPDEDGLSVLEKVLRLDSTIEVIVMSGHGNIETAVKAIKKGAFDFLEKPLHFEKLLVLVKHVFQLKELRNENRYLREELEEGERLVSASASMKKVADLIEALAPSSGWVTIQGENGSGKELVARLLHQRSGRSHRRLVKVNCAELTKENVQTVMLGAGDGEVLGKLEMADGGSLLLDGVDETSLEVQERMVAVLEQSAGEVRVIATTTSDLRERVEAGKFSERLYVRLKVVPLPVPPLRERRDDIPLLVDRFLRRYSGGKIRGVSEATMSFIQTYPWPGNVRELKNWIERACILSNGELLDILDSGDSEAGRELDFIPYGGKSLRVARANFEKQFLLKMLSENGGNISKTAQRIGLERSYLHKKIKSYGIEVSTN